MNLENKRGLTVAVFGLIAQAVLTVLLLTIRQFSGSLAMNAAMLLTATGLPVWLITAALFYCRHMAEMEALEIAELAKGRPEGLFGEEAVELRLAQRRLRWLTRLSGPAATLVLAAYLLTMAFLLGRPLLAGLTPWPGRGAALTWALACLFGAFVAFLFSRYAIGMAKDSCWRLLRAGGGYLTIGVLAAALGSAGFFLLHLKFTWPMTVLVYAFPIMMAVLGAELLLNFVLQFYRPRIEGVEERPSFDSRLLNLLSEPGSVARSVAEAMNYQFGFEVSSTWFYKLLRRTLLPLLIFGALVLVAVSSIVIVGPGAQGVVLTWGRLDDARGALSPGFHLKWPWPVQTAEVMEVGRIRTLTIGASGHREKPPPRNPAGVELSLWADEHGKGQEVDFLVGRAPAKKRSSSEEGPPATQPASQPATQAADGEEKDKAEGKIPGGVALLRMVMDIQYKVTDVYKFYYNVADAEELLSDLAYQKLTSYAARHDVDALISGQREQMTEQLWREIVRGAGPEEMDLGVEIVLVALQGVHPPPELAEAFEEEVKAKYEREGLILAAHGIAAKTLIQVAGSVKKAKHMAGLLDRHEGEKALIAAIDALGGDAKVLIHKARGFRWREANAQRARTDSVRSRLRAFTAAPQLYMIEQKLAVLAKGLVDAHKYIIGIPLDRLEVRHVDKRRTVTGGLLLGGEE